jgi:chemotaxis response regulator CheB
MLRSLSPAMTNLDSSGKPVKVLLADDSGVMLRAVTRLLSDCPQVQLVGAAEDFEKIVHLASELKPEVIVLDLRMAEKARTDVLRLKTQQATLQVLAITASAVDDNETRALARRIGADKLLDKMQLSDKLIPAIFQLADRLR